MYIILSSSFRSFRFVSTVSPVFATFFKQPSLRPLRFLQIDYTMYTFVNIKTKVIEHFQSKVRRRGGGFLSPIFGNIFSVHLEIRKI